MRTVFVLLLVSSAAGCYPPAVDVIEGQVVDRFGKPIVGATVGLGTDLDFEGPPGHPLDTVTDAKGQFRLTIEHDRRVDLRLQLVVSGPDYTTRTFSFTSSDRRSLPSRIELRSAPGLTSDW